MLREITAGVKMVLAMRVGRNLAIFVLNFLSKRHGVDEVFRLRAYTHRISPYPSSTDPKTPRKYSTTSSNDRQPGGAPLRKAVLQSPDLEAAGAKQRDRLKGE